MPLSRGDRFQLKSRILEQMGEDPSWDFSRQNLLLGEFGFPLMGGDYNGPSFDELITTITDSSLIEMYSVVTGVPQEQVAGSVTPTELDSWRPGYVRMFLSHSARHKDFVGEVAEHLAEAGIHGFVAHDSMRVSESWRVQIEQALRSMQVFVAIHHPEFSDSAWCQQEVGWALGVGVPKYVVRVGSDPLGFVSQDQWPSGFDLSPKQMADKIGAWAATIPGIGDLLIEGYLAALADADSYMTAGRTAARIAALDGLTEVQWNLLDSIYWTNDQVRGGGLPRRQLEPFYSHNRRQWPPPDRR
ncbi:toll/interleukin-1 receptor domain-containing protein [Plantibacter sp. M259]|uniref:toll/interleukin-1 receptor domain-containing protein n=1 Tax=Plantibacter sp. M259 TaxID=2583822 RepID=UPI001110426A|nr:TIR domain-containing protein [Plantibacter sp. M259]